MSLFPISTRSFVATRTGCGMPSYFPYRLVPVAAQLAVASAPPSVDLGAVQRRSMEFFAAIPRPPLLAGAAPLSPQRASSLARIARSVDLAGAGG